MRINIDFYIGTAEEISSLWKDYLNTTNLSELIYITRLCQFTDQSRINIDKENLIFYNYQIQDKISVDKNQFYINNSLLNSNLIIFNNQHEDSKFLKENKLNIYVINQVKNQDNLLPELIILIIIISILVLCKFNLYSLLAGGFIFLLFLEWRLHVTFLDLSVNLKIFSFLLDIIHSVLFILASLLTLYLYILILFWKYNTKATIILNISILIVYFGFFIFRRCIIQIWYDKITKYPSYFYSISNRVFEYLFNHNPYFTEKRIYEQHLKKKESNTRSNIDEFMSSHIISCSSLIILNTYLLIRIYFFPKT